MSESSISRRTFIAAGGGVLAAGALMALASRPTPVWADDLDLSVRWLTDLNSMSHLTYPHANGFFNGGTDMVIRQSPFPTTDPALLHIITLATGAQVALPPRSPGREMLGGYFDVCEANGKLVIPESQAQANIDGTGIKIFTLDVAQYLIDGTSCWQVVYELPVGKLVADGMVAWHSSGTKIAFSMMSGDPLPSPQIPGDRHCDIVEVDLTTGVSEVLVSRDKLLNHVHYHPAFPNWLMFSREGDVTLHTERVWAHHRTYVPNGGCVVPQILAGGPVLRLAHERAAFHDDSIIAINYGNPRGVWRGRVNSSTPVKIADGWFEHCDVSRDGRFVVVDTADPVIFRGGAIDLIDTHNGNQIIRLASGLIRGDAHPRHLHPIFSPDGNYVLFNAPDLADRNAGALQIGIVDISSI